MAAFGVQVPLSAASGTPTWAVPTTAGARVLRNVPGAIGAVGAELATASSYPFWVAVTRSVMTVRRSAGVTLYVVPVAPSIGLPSAIHCRWIRPAGVHVPGPAVSSWSTCAVPEIVGADVTRNWPGATAVLTSESTAFVV